eukprot:scaffold268689_cov41-Tisochrysis_lutea.AAC.3
MRPSASSDEVERAKKKFAETAAAQRKLLLAAGLKPAHVSRKMMDQLIENRSAPSCTSDEGLSELHQLISETGFETVHAAGTLMLRDEIARLRSQGHSTAEVIQQLDHRLSSVTKLRTTSDENLLCMPQKKLKLCEGSPHNLPASRPRSTPCVWDVAASRPLADKRPREEVPKDVKAVKLCRSRTEDGEEQVI